MSNADDILGSIVEFAVTSSIDYDEFIKSNDVSKTEKFILFFIIFIFVYLLSMLLVYMVLEGRTCPPNNQITIIQREYFNLFSPEYEMLEQQGEDTNISLPIMKVDSKQFEEGNSILDIFLNWVFPPFKIRKHDDDIENAFQTRKFEEIDFLQDRTFSSLVFPTYTIYKKDSTEEIAKLIYPTSFDEFTFSTVLATLGLQYRYFLLYNDKIYMTTEKILDFEANKHIYFAEVDDTSGKVGQQICFMKRRIATLRSAAWTLCFPNDIEISGELKTLMFGCMSIMDYCFFRKQEYDDRLI